MKYKIAAYRFSGKEYERYTYELTFNKSLIHTGRWKGIEAGLDAYEKWENSSGFKKWILGKVWEFHKSFGIPKMPNPPSPPLKKGYESEIPLNPLTEPTIL